MTENEFRMAIVAAVIGAKIKDTGQTVPQGVRETIVKLAYQMADLAWQEEVQRRA